MIVHNCHFCAYRASNGLSVEQFGGLSKKGLPTHNPYRMIPAEKVREILRDAADIGIKAITWTGGGEPTAHPDHLELFREALDLGIECGLNTNGSVLKRGWEDVYPRFTYARFSVDAGSAEEYAAVRRVSEKEYGRVLKNIEALVAECRARGSACTLGAGYVVSPTSWRLLDQGVRRLRDAGLSYVRLASMQSTEQAAAYPPEDLAAARAACREAEALSAPGFQVVNIFDAALGRRFDDPLCGMQYLVLYVGGDQKVYRCCYVAYTKHGEAGDLSKQSLKEWFYSVARRVSYDAFDARSCDVCPLADKNDAIAQLVKRPPPHANFI